MPKYRVLVECRNEGGADIHCWSGIEAPNGVEAERLAVQALPRVRRVRARENGGTEMIGGVWQWLRKRR